MLDSVRLEFRPFMPSHHNLLHASIGYTGTAVGQSPTGSRPEMLAHFISWHWTVPMPTLLSH
eukprot:338379-Lingulodinium_polyedra.AAC.1